MQGAKVRAQGAKVRAQGAKVRASISASWYRMQQQHATTTTTSDRIGPAQHDAAISATCVRARFVEEIGALMQVALIAASCCAGPIVLLHTWWLTLCNLDWWCFFIHPLAQILHLHSGNLHCVVVVCVVNTVQVAIYPTNLKLVG